MPHGLSDLAWIAGGLTPGAGDVDGGVGLGVLGGVALTLMAMAAAIWATRRPDPVDTGNALDRREFRPRLPTPIDVAIARVQQADPHFSAPMFRTRAAQQLAAHHDGAVRVAAVTLEAARPAAIDVVFEASVEADGVARDRIERWRFIRGEKGWEHGPIRVLRDEPQAPLTVHLTGGGVEPGSSAPPLAQPHFSARWRAFLATTDFDPAAFETRARTVFEGVQGGGGTDLMSEVMARGHGYWTARYHRDGLERHREALEIVSLTPCGLEIDARVEAITVHVRARMLDYTTDAKQRVVGGNKWVHREFAEYWTLIRDRAGGDWVVDEICG